MKKALLTIALALLLSACLGSAAICKTTVRYTTQATAFKDKQGKTIFKAKRNTKCTLIRSGKKMCKIKYKGNAYYCRKKYLSDKKAVKKFTGSYFKFAGVIYWRGFKYTWYSQRVLPGNGLKIPGRHMDKQGFICDNKGYIVLGSSARNRGRIVATPFGKYGKVYDCGYVTNNWFDVYVGW